MSGQGCARRIALVDEFELTRRDAVFVQTPCGVNVFGRGGVCGDVAGVATCLCSMGFAGAACLPCPGGAARPCSGHGSCIGLADGTMCACQVN